MKRSRMRTNAGRRVATKGLFLVLPLMLGLTLGSCGETGGDAAPSEAATPTALPAGYALRLDRQNRDRANFVATVDDDGTLSVQTGPAGILYRPDDVIEADGYTLRGRFTEMNAPMEHREGFGLFIGGQGLGDADQRYLYFLVRGDGRYLIKQRRGDATRDLSEGWQPSDAVRAPTTGDSDVSNELSIVVEGAEIRFSCNGEEVASLPVGDVSSLGVVGVRVNHNLQVRIEDFDLAR
jgi:hypothetical protein